MPAYNGLKVRTASFYFTDLLTKLDGVVNFAAIQREILFSLFLRCTKLTS